jgi:hypothetical protein
MSDKIFIKGNVKNRELLRGKNKLPLADKVDKETLIKTIEEKNELIKDSATKSVTEQGKGKTARIPIKGENTTEYFKNHQIPKPEPLPKPEVKTSKLNQVISKVDDLVEKAIPYIDNVIEKTAPYIDDVAKGLGAVAKVGGIASGVIGFLNPESTATDAQMEEVERRHEQESQQKVEEPNKHETPPRIENIQGIQNLSAVEKENITSVFKDWAETEQPSYLQGMEKEIEVEQPSYLQGMEKNTSNLEFEIDEIATELPSMDMDMDGDSGSDGGDGGSE